MKTSQNFFFVLAAIFIVASGAFHHAAADHDKHGKRYRHGNKYENAGKHSLGSVTNRIYEEKCGACHFAYQPELLPSGSWKKILAGLDNHFGQAVAADSESLKILSEYLKTNAAEYSSSELSSKIMKSLKHAIPSKITEIPHIVKKHRGISSDTKSLSDCMACHKTADKGIYDKHAVNIPK